MLNVIIILSIHFVIALLVSFSREKSRRELLIADFIFHVESEFKTHVSRVVGRINRYLERQPDALQSLSDQSPIVVTLEEAVFPDSETLIIDDRFRVLYHSDERMKGDIALFREMIRAARESGACQYNFYIESGIHQRFGAVCPLAGGEAFYVETAELGSTIAFFRARNRLLP